MTSVFYPPDSTLIFLLFLSLPPFSKRRGASWITQVFLNVFWQKVYKVNSRKTNKSVSRKNIRGSFSSYFLGKILLRNLNIFLYLSACRRKFILISSKEIKLTGRRVEKETCQDLFYIRPEQRNFICFVSPCGIKSVCWNNLRFALRKTNFLF